MNLWIIATDESQPTEAATSKRSLSAYLVIQQDYIYLV